MKQFLPILILVCSAWAQVGGEPHPAAAQASSQSASQSQAAVPADQQNAQKAKAIVDQGIAALGGQTYLTLRDREQQGRIYSFHHGRESGGGVFWSFFEFPDKERVELTKERDIAELYVGDKAYEITYKGTATLDPKQLSDYLRRREHSLEWVLRQWLKEPAVVLLYEGTAVAADKPADKVSVLNAKNDSVTLYIDSSTHLPIKKTYSWRDPTDQLLNTEDEVYDAYRLTEGIMTPYSITRFYNGETSAQRFLATVNYNQNLNDSMFDAKVPAEIPKK